ncbi:uncharacterized protein LOC117514532 isoform X2 [Thalassophryne amazonica]|uniref:uncharacterized protein LOC117514532 isoform X2 n=1 Tax=Thalassophryne amazonica TaxID=390379 RepID=UPI001471C17B|nr:uncharacterized protein LOC117514532 isoform X2 [Thalassophryne amazonica]
MMPSSDLALLFVALLQITSECTDVKTIQAVKAAPGTQVRLSCPINKTSGRVGNITWLKVKGGLESMIFNSNNTTLTIQTVSSSDSGLYRCKHSLGQSQHCFDIHLHVQEEDVVVATTTETSPIIATQTVPVITTENVWEQLKTDRTFIITVASVVTGIALTAALTAGFIACHRCVVHRINAHNQSQPEIFAPVNVFEIMDAAASEELTAQQINSLYNHFQNETLSSFKYD